MLEGFYKWRLRKEKELMDSGTFTLKEGAKAFGLGALDGAIICATVVGTIWYASAIISLIAKKPVWLIKGR